MILPRNGRIVVIDDKTEEEAIPLLSSLYLNGFPALYFKGEKKDLPKEPLNDIRVVFLDLEIIVEGYTGQDNRSKAATTARILSSVINTTIPTIYLLVLWSTHEEELLDYFWRYLKENNYNCVFLPVSLDKIKCRAADYDIALIEKEIEEKLQGNDGFRFLIRWENLIHKSSNDVINEILSLYGGDGDPDKFLLGVFKKLAEAYAGENLNEDSPTQISQYAMLAFNGTFSDSLESNISSVENTEISFDRIAGVTNKSVIAKINSKLLLDQNNTNVKPGCIYINPEENNFQDYFNSVNDLNGIEKIFCEVSPTCDYVQRKWKCHRILYGIKVPVEQTKKLKGKADNLYNTDVFDIDGKMVKFVFDLRKLKSKNLGELNSLKPLCTFRHDLLIDMQHKIASHCSRPGMLSL